MKLVRNFLAAFALYTRLPVPHLEWREDDLKYSLFFLPWVGALIGGVIAAILLLPGSWWAPLLFKVCVVTAVPLLTTGGFHLDGYLDVQDALRSYKSREEKLEILKDPHIGAFAVIGVAILATLWCGASSLVLNDSDAAVIFACIFFHGRALGAFAATLFKRAKKDGLLAEETKKANWLVIALLTLESLAFDFVTWLVCGTYAFWMLAGALFAFWRCKRIAYREFGGFTGDSVGWLVVSTELGMVLAVAVALLFQS